MENNLCKCGCGGRTAISKRNRLTIKKGEYAQYIPGHNMLVNKINNLEHGKHYRNGKYNQYIIQKCPDHPRADSKGYVFEHILIADKVLGKHLPHKAVIHHVDGDGTNNLPANLVICNNNAYHLFLHQRIRAYKATGSPHKRQCEFCRKWDMPLNMFVKSNRAYHRSCKKEYINQLKERRP